MKTRWLLLIPVMSLAAAAAYSHGGVGVPVVSLTRPALGEIMDAVDDGAAIRWIDSDPDDNANLTLLFTADINNPAGSQTIADHLGEDCDPDGDGGVRFTGVIDAGFDQDGGAIDASYDLDLLTREYCTRHVDAGPCNEDVDCHLWDTSAVPTGNYRVLGVLDDHYPDGGGGALSFSTARGLVRVSRAGENVPPALLFTQPDGVGDQVDTCFRVRWIDSDPDDNAVIRLYVKRAFTTQPAMLVAEQLLEDDADNAFDVDMSGAVDLADYEVIAEIDDGHRPAFRTQSAGYVTRFRARPQDGGCVGPPPQWPDGSVWPVRDAGSADAAVTAGDGGVDGSVAPLLDAGSTVDAGGLVDSGPRPAPPGCPNCQMSGSASPLLLLGLLVLLRRRR